MSKDDIIRILREHLPELRRDYQASDLALAQAGLRLFGSFVRGEQRKRSDVDLLALIKQEG